MLKTLLIFLLLFSFTLPVWSRDKNVLNPTKGIGDVISFGEEINIDKAKEAFGNLTKVDRPGLNSDNADIKIYNFTRGFTCLTANDKVVQMQIGSDNIVLDSGVKVGDDAGDITDEYGNVFVTEGNPKYGEGTMIFNLYPDYIIAFTINYEGKCTNIMCANCDLIYKMSPSTSILKYWDAPVDIKSASSRDTIKIMKNTSSVDGKYMIVKGEILNIGNKELRYVQAGVTFYDVNGQVVDVVNAYIPGIHLQPGETSPFTVISTQGKLTATYNIKITNQ